MPTACHLPLHKGGLGKKLQLQPEGDASPFNRRYIDKDITDITNRHFPFSAKYDKINPYENNADFEGRSRCAKP